MENLEAGVAFVCSQQRFEESDYVKVKELLDDLPAKCSQRDEIGLERSFERFLYITDLYQEQSHLLDQKLDAMLSVLLDYVKKYWLDEAPPLLIFEAFKYVCHLTKIRGRKVILRHLPHELTDLEPVLKLLERDNMAGSSSFWETRYVLLLWLTLLCKLPFPLSKFDLSSAPVDEHTTPRAPIKQRMLNVATPLLNVMDKSREAAALFLAEFVSRPDTVDEYLTIVIRDTVDSLSRLNPNDVQEGLRAVGLCLLLADIFKRNKRDKLLPVSDYVLNMLIDADTLTTNCQNILLRKLITKLVQRIGLVYLKPQLASWRYQRGSRSLAQNLSVDHKVGQMNGVETNRKMDQDESSAYEVREEVERILAFLLHALKDKDTIVRWSAAKGVGRIASRLPKSLASEVIASILTYFNRRESDGAWHGACLALAELGRRGFLLPDQLPAVVPAVVQALTFDESKGNYSVGAHVRDAACYLCWSFARCYEPDQLLPFVGRIASTLITVAIFDREVNCRRAASAAFQENVGRQGVFPHGIDILTVIDYFAVGNRSTCYKDLSIFVGKFPEYTKFLIDHLVDFKINHWDQEIRQLAALSLRQLCSLDANYLKICILPRLLPQCTGTDDLFLRHGSILAVGEICRGLNDLSVDDIGDVIDRSTILAIPGLLVEMQSLKNVGGELIRSALNRFIENVSISFELIPAITIDHLSVYFDVLNENLCNVTEDIRLEACSSISALSRRASTCANFSCLPYVDKHCRTLAESSTELQRIGAALALGNLADDFLRRCDLPRIIDFLCRSASIAVDDKDKHWAECRRDSLDSLRKIVITTRLSVNPVLQEAKILIGPPTLRRIMQITLKSFDDYTVDSRGDVGAIVRETAARSTRAYLCKLADDVIDETDRSQFCDPDFVHSLMCKLVQQCCEKIDRTRQIACEAVTKIIDHRPIVVGIQQVDLLKSIFSNESIAEYNQSIRWYIDKEAFPKLLQLLHCPEYLYNALLGFVVTAGGVGESLAKTATESLMNFVNEIHENSLQLELFVETMLQIFKDFQKIDRVSIPLMKVFDMILTSNYLDAYANSTNLETLYTLTVNETGKSKKQQKINAGLAIFCDLLQFENTSAARQALRQVIRTLTHPYPRSRRQAANQLYEALLAYGALDNHSEQALTYLTETDWDADIGSLKDAKLEIARLLKIDL